VSVTAAVSYFLKSNIMLRRCGCNFFEPIKSSFHFFLNDCDFPSFAFSLRKARNKVSPFRDTREFEHLFYDALSIGNIDISATKVFQHSS
jgi:hypothetical protein